MKCTVAPSDTCHPERSEEPFLPGARPLRGALFFQQPPSAPRSGARFRHWRARLREKRQKHINTSTLTLKTSTPMSPDAPLFRSASLRPRRRGSRPRRARRAFGLSRFAPRAAAYDRDARFPPELRRLRTRGLLGVGGGEARLRARILHQSSPSTIAGGERQLDRLVVVEAASASPTKPSASSPRSASSTTSSTSPKGSSTPPRLLRRHLQTFSSSCRDSLLHRSPPTTSPRLENSSTILTTTHHRPHP